MSEMLELIRSKQARYAANFARDNWHEDELSDMGWLGLVAVPWLLAQLDGDGNNQSDNRNCNGDPRTNSVWLPESSLQFMLPKQTMPDPALVVITGNPVAKFLVRFVAKIVGVKFARHMSSNVEAQAHAEEEMNERQMRDECAKIAAEWGAGGLAGDTIYEDFAVELAKRVRAAERERCIAECKVVADDVTDAAKMGAMECWRRLALGA